MVAENHLHVVIRWSGELYLTYGKIQLTEVALVSGCECSLTSGGK
jgi:hypothetical protein